MKIHISAEQWSGPLVALALLGIFVCVLLLSGVDPEFVTVLSMPLIALAGGIAAKGSSAASPSGQEQP